MDKLKLTSSFEELVKSVNKKAVFPEKPQGATPLVSGESIPDKIYYDTLKDIDEYLASLTYQDIGEGRYIAILFNTVEVSGEVALIAEKMGDMYGTFCINDDFLADTNILANIISYISHNASAELLAAYGLTHTGWQKESDSFVNVKTNYGQLTLSDVDSNATFISSTPFVNYEKSNGGIYLRALADGTYEWTNARETVFPSAGENIIPTALNVGDKIDALYFDSSRDIDADLAALTYDEYGMTYLCEFVESSSLIAVIYVPIGASGNAEPAYVAILMDSSINAQRVIYASKSTPMDMVASMGVTHTGWQMDSYTFASAETVAVLSAESIDYISSTPFRPDYSKGLFLRNTADGEYKWENPFPSARINLSVRDALPSKISFDASFNIENYLRSLTYDNLSNSTIIEADGSAVLVATKLPSDVSPNGGYYIWSTNTKDKEVFYFSSYLTDDTLNSFKDFYGDIVRGWNVSSVEFSDDVIGKAITALANNPTFITREHTAEDYEKGLYLKLLKDGSRTWGTPAGSSGNSIESIEQTTTSTEDSGVNIITATLTDGTVTTFEIRNGATGATGKGILEIVESGPVTESDGYTISPIQIRYTDGTAEILNIKAKNGEGADTSKYAHLEGVNTFKGINVFTSITQFDGDAYALNGFNVGRYTDASTAEKTTYGLNTITLKKNSSTYNLALPEKSGIIATIDTNNTWTGSNDFQSISATYLYMNDDNSYKEEGVFSTEYHDGYIEITDTDLEYHQLRFPPKSGTLATVDDTKLYRHRASFNASQGAITTGSTDFTFYLDFYNRVSTAYTTASELLAAAIGQGEYMPVSGIYRYSIKNTSGLSATTFPIVYVTRSSSDVYSALTVETAGAPSHTLTAYISAATVTDKVTEI